MCGGDGMGCKKILWLSDDNFKPIQAQVLALMKIFCCEIQIVRRSLSLNINEVIEILKGTDFVGVVIASNMSEILAPFITDRITVPVFLPDFILANRPEDADLIVKMPCGVNKLHFRRFNRLVRVGCDEIVLN